MTPTTRRRPVRTVYLRDIRVCQPEGHGAHHLLVAQYRECGEGSRLPPDSRTFKEMLGVLMTVRIRHPWHPQCNRSVAATLDENVLVCGLPAAQANQSLEWLWTVGKVQHGCDQTVMATRRAIEKPRTTGAPPSGTG